MTNQRTGKNGFTNFSEISYEKTRASYDHSEIPLKSQKFLPAHKLGLTVEQANASDLGHPCLTQRPQIVSETGPSETNETLNSYETLRRSYKRCLAQHPNRIWPGHSAETQMKPLVSTTPPNPVPHRYPPCQYTSAIINAPVYPRCPPMDRST